MSGAALETAEVIDLQAAIKKAQAEAPEAKKLAAAIDRDFYEFILRPVLNCTA